MTGALLSIAASLLCIAAVIGGSLPLALCGFAVAVVGLLVSCLEHMRTDADREQVGRILRRADRWERR